MIDTLEYDSDLLVVGRGDSPALAVLDRNARSLAQRVADETKEELEKVLKRVDNVRIFFFFDLLLHNLKYTHAILKRSFILYYPRLHVVIMPLFLPSAI